LIKIDCNNKLLLNTVKSYLSQKDYIFSTNNEKHQILIKIINTDKIITLEINGEKIELILPVDINNLITQILKKISDTNFLLGDCKYFPYQRIISSSKRKSLLSDIQNIIITNLILTDVGINKESLYKKIWKRDKSIFINKLDTHLTNLKKKLKQELDIKINFQSQNKNLKLIID